MTLTWNDGLKVRIAEAAEVGCLLAAEKVMEAGNDLIRSGPKTGAVYDTLFFTRGSGSERQIIPYGERDPHQASAPGEAPAYDTGELVAKSRTNAIPGGGQAEWYADYAIYLARGTDRIAPRPFDTLALEREQDNIRDIVNRTVAEAL